jgi:hypothetical protein
MDKMFENVKVCSSKEILSQVFKDISAFVMKDGTIFVVNETANESEQNTNEDDSHRFVELEKGDIVELRDGNLEMVMGFGDHWDKRHTMGDNLYTIFLTNNRTYNIYGKACRNQLTPYDIIRIVIKKRFSHILENDIAEVKRNVSGETIYCPIIGVTKDYIELDMGMTTDNKFNRIKGCNSNQDYFITRIFKPKS